MGADLIKRMKGVGEKNAEVSGSDMDVFHFHVPGVSIINKVEGFNMNIIFSTSSSTVSYTHLTLPTIYSV